MAELYFTSSGSGEALVLLHGLFGSSKNWQSHARQFSQQFQVVNFDLRNHGQSFHAEVMNYSVMAEDVARQLHHLNLADCQVLGHSMGGKVAMLLALRYPQLVSRLIVADIAPVAYFHDYNDLIDPILQLRLDSLESRAQADQRLRANIPEDQLRAFLLQNLVREEGGWRWRVNWSIIRQEIQNLTGFEALSEGWMIDIPSLFIRGAKSDYITEQEVELIESHFSNVSVKTIADAGHWLHAEKPEAFARLVLDFLNQ